MEFQAWKWRSLVMRLANGQEKNNLQSEIRLRIKGLSMERSVCAIGYVRRFLTFEKWLLISFFIALYCVLKLCFAWESSSRGFTGGFCWEILLGYLGLCRVHCAWALNCHVITHCFDCTKHLLFSMQMHITVKTLNNTNGRCT